MLTRLKACIAAARCPGVLADLQRRGVRPTSSRNTCPPEWDQTESGKPPTSRLASGCDALSRGGGLTAGYKPRSNCCSSSHGKMIRRAMKYQPIGLTGCDTATAEGWKESCGTTVSISSTLPLCYSLCEMPSMTQLPTARASYRPSFTLQARKVSMPSY